MYMTLSDDCKEEGWSFSFSFPLAALSPASYGGNGQWIAGSLAAYWLLAQARDITPLFFLIFRVLILFCLRVEGKARAFHYQGVRRTTETVSQESAQLSPWWGRVIIFSTACGFPVKVGLPFHAHTQERGAYLLPAPSPIGSLEKIRLLCLLSSEDNSLRVALQAKC